jgi:hypothetical protein
MNKPRNHHFVPRFWQKHFSLNGTALVWAYDYDDDIVRERSVKVMMQERDLYTVDPQGSVDVSLETDELSEVDTGGADLLQAIIGKDGSADTRANFADFLAVQALRVPATVKRYGELTQSLILQLLEVSAATDYADFIARIRAKGGAALDFDEAYYEVLRLIPQSALELIVENRVEAVATADGDPDLPHTDAIRDRTARVRIAARLLAMTWTVKHFAGPVLVLGDMGVVFEKGNIDQGLRAPLTPSLALFIAPGETPAPMTIAFEDGRDHEARDLNYETAARSTRWLIGTTPAVVETYRPQVRG